MFIKQNIFTEQLHKNISWKKEKKKKILLDNFIMNCICDEICHNSEGSYSLIFSIYPRISRNVTFLILNTFFFNVGNFSLVLSALQGWAIFIRLECQRKIHGYNFITKDDGQYYMKLQRLSKGNCARISFLSPL